MAGAAGPPRRRTGSAGRRPPRAAGARPVRCRASAGDRAARRAGRPRAGRPGRGRCRRPAAGSGAARRPGGAAAAARSRRPSAGPRGRRPGRPARPIRAAPRSRPRRTGTGRPPGRSRRGAVDRGQRVADRGRHLGPGAQDPAPRPQRRRAGVVDAAAPDDRGRRAVERLLDGAGLADARRSAHQDEAARAGPGTVQGSADAASSTSRPTKGRRPRPGRAGVRHRGSIPPPLGPAYGICVPDLSGSTDVRSPPRAEGRPSGPVGGPRGREDPMHATIHRFRRWPDEDAGTWARSLLAGIGGDGQDEACVLDRLDGADGAVVVLWRSAADAAGARAPTRGPGRRRRLRGRRAGAGVGGGLGPRSRQLIWFNGGDAARTDAAVRAGRERIAPAVRDVDGVVATWVLRGDDDPLVVVALVTALEVLDDIRRAVFATDCSRGRTRRCCPIPTGSTSTACCAPTSRRRCGRDRPAPAPVLAAGTWTVSDSRTRVSFTVRNLGRAVHGSVACRCGRGGGRRDGRPGAGAGRARPRPASTPGSPSGTPTCASRGSSRHRPAAGDDVDGRPVHPGRRRPVDGRRACCRCAARRAR